MCKDTENPRNYGIDSENKGSCWQLGVTGRNDMPGV